MRLTHAPARRHGLTSPQAQDGGVIVVLALVATLVASPAIALAAAPPAPPQDPFPTVETWIDGTIEAPPDSPAGGKVLLGVTFWNVRDHKLFSLGGLVARLFPAKGSAEPSVAELTSDAVGHASAQLGIPKGGIGRVEIDTTGQQCTADGKCAVVYQPLRIAGTGPPPDAPVGQLVRAALLPITGDVVAGRPTKIAVEVTPIGLWKPDALQLPSVLQVAISRVSGGRLGNAQLQQDAPSSGLPYQGSLQVSEPGQMSLRPAFVNQDGTTTPINSELGPIQVIGTPVRADGASAVPATTAAGVPQAPAPGDQAAADSGPPWVLIGAIVVLALGLVLFLGDPIRRRLRGTDDERR